MMTLLIATGLLFILFGFFCTRAVFYFKEAIFKANPDQMLPIRILYDSPFFERLSQSVDPEVVKLRKKYYFSFLLSIVLGIATFICFQNSFIAKVI